MPRRKTPVEDVPCENVFHFLYRILRKEKPKKKRKRKSKSLPLAHRRIPESSGRRHSWCLSGVPENQYWNALYTTNVSTQTSATNSPTTVHRQLFHPLKCLQRKSRLDDYLDSKEASTSFEQPLVDSEDDLSPPSPAPETSEPRKWYRSAQQFEDLSPEGGVLLEESHLSETSKNERALGGNFNRVNFFADNELYSPKFVSKIDKHFDISNLQLDISSSRQSQTSMHRMNTIDDQDRKIIIEFCHLLEKAKQLFNGLRELPQYGHKQWHSYFGRTFDVYTKLWKFQQQHRAILDSKYGLKRWQIGEIASKIGQLYYHFYLRTSETAYLNEAFSFYSAIRGRSYYTKASKEDRCELMVKKLRYYARFIVVCLLLKKVNFVRDLIKELDKQIVEYGNTYDPDDQLEWVIVVDEVKAFVQAEQVISVQHPDSCPIVLSHRLSPMNTPPVERTSQMTLSLQEVVIVGSSNQVKFSELTMDMFRILQTLEREPLETVQHHHDESPRHRFIAAPIAPTSKGYNSESRRDINPHKYLLFKPSPTQVLVYLSSGCHDLPPNGALLLYISADGHTELCKHPEEASASYEISGLITTSRSDIYRDANRTQESKPGPSTSKFKEARCLYPEDLVPYTRRPMFIIIESDKSYVFQQIPRYFAQPLIIMMSPVELPERLEDRNQDGNLFTLFLHCPLSAVCYLSDIINFTLPHWEKAMSIVDKFMVEASTIMSRTRIDPAFFAFMGDDFFRLLLLRFIFCEITIRRHKSFRTRNQHPKLLPALPEDIYENAALNYFVLELATHLQVRGHFNEPVVQPPTKEVTRRAAAAAYAKDVASTVSDKVADTVAEKVMQKYEKR